MPDLNLYWGELHNHNELGYAQGSLERSYEIARSHGLHADGGVPDGYPVVVANWERITCFPAYDAHHTAYERGVDWEGFDESLSPVVEIFSEHGSSERDTGLHPMLGPRRPLRRLAETADHGGHRRPRRGALARRGGLDGRGRERGGAPARLPGRGLGYAQERGSGARQHSSSDPFDEVRRKRILEWDDGRCAWQSHTSRGSVFTTRNGSTAPRANDALCVEVEGTEETRVELEFDCRTSKSLLATATDFTLTGQLGDSRASFTIGELLKGRRGWRVDGLPTWIVAHRALPPALYALEGHFIDRGAGPACCYLRVTQENGQMAWSSPIWFED